MTEMTTNFMFLNINNRWPDFQSEGLIHRPDGIVELYALPRLQGELASGLETLATLDGPAGLAADWDGTVYLSDPGSNRIFRIAEGSEAEHIVCLENGQPIEFNKPRGIAILPKQRWLIVTDSGNHCVRIIDIDSLKLVRNLSDPSNFGSADIGHLDTPLSLAADTIGNCFIVDSGNRRIQMFDANGICIPAFWDMMQATGLIIKPVTIAIDEKQETSRLFIVDADGNRILVFDPQGHAITDENNMPVQLGAPQLQNTVSIVVADDTVYAGDSGSNSVLVFKQKDRHYVLAGKALDWSGPVAALALKDRNTLLVYPELDGTGNIALLEREGGYASTGLMWSSQPLCVEKTKPLWQRLHAWMEKIGLNSHFQFFVNISDSSDLPQVGSLDSQTPFHSSIWQPISHDADDFYIGSEPSRYLWLGVLFTGDGNGTARLSQMRIDFDNNTYLQYLPPFYSTEDSSRKFLDRFLSLFASFFHEVEEEISSLPILFNPSAVPKEWLPWLAEWLAVPLRSDFIKHAYETDENFKQRTIRNNREFLQKAITVAPYRGTLFALETMLRSWLKDELLEMNPPVRLLTDLTRSFNDVDTIFQLAPQNDADKKPGVPYAQIGVTTVLGEGPPHYFIVELVPDPALCELRYPGNLERFVRAARFLLDREKPTHTNYDLRLRARLLTMQLMPEESMDKRPNEVYAQIGETTWLADDR